MADIQAIIRSIDTYLNKVGRDSIGPVEANQILQEMGLLNDSITRPGLPLRRILRNGEIPHAYQPAGKGTEWIIPLSNKTINNATLTSQPSINLTKIYAIKSSLAASNQLEYVTNELMHEKNFMSADKIDNFVPNHPGLYCIRISNLASLPAQYASILSSRGHNVLYVGIASKSLKVRFLGQELRAEGHGTFFRSIGAMLGYKPVKGALKNKANKKNFVFTPDTETLIIKWINSNLIVNWVEFTGDLESLEIPIIREYVPLLNIKHNPAALEILIQARAECVRIACE